METHKHGSWITHTPQIEGKIESVRVCVCVRACLRDIQQQTSEMRASQRRHGHNGRNRTSNIKHTLKWAKCMSIN